MMTAHIIPRLHRRRAETKKNKEKNGACRFLSLAMKIELHYQRFLFNYEQYINHEASRISALPILF